LAKTAALLRLSRGQCQPFFHGWAPQIAAPQKLPPGGLLWTAMRQGPICPLMAAKKKQDPNYKVIAENRRARYDYAIEDDLECGIVLQGSEVKSLRQGQANIAESYAAVEDGELWLINSYIAPYEQARTWGHEERRKRKLLVSKKELARLWDATRRKGMTLVPLVLYFNHKGLAKLKIGIARGKKTQDKRATEAKRDWQRQKARLLRERG
jgi:SsrA-binding protein